MKKAIAVGGKDLYALMKGESPPAGGQEMSDREPEEKRRFHKEREKQPKRPMQKLCFSDQIRKKGKKSSYSGEEREERGGSMHGKKEKSAVIFKKKRIGCLAFLSARNCRSPLSIMRTTRREKERPIRRT